MSKERGRGSVTYLEWKFDMKKMMVYYHLGIFQVVEIFFLRKRFAQTYYFNISKFAIIFLYIFGLQKTVCPLDFILEKIRDEQGENYLPKILSEQMILLCNQLSNEVARKNRFLVSVGGLFDKERMFIYFKRCIQEEVEDIIIFCNVIKWHVSKLGTAQAQNITFVVPSSPYVGVICNFAVKEFNIRIISRFSFDKIQSLVRSLAKNIGKMFFTLFEAFTLKNIIPFLYKSKTSSLDQPMVGISYSGFGSITFDKTKRCEFPWLFDVHIPPEQVCLYFRRHDLPISNEDLHLLSEKGIRYTYFGYNKKLLPHIRPYIPTFRGVKILLWLNAKTFYFLIHEIFRLRWSSIRYLDRIIAFIVHYSRAFDFYEMHNIKVNVDYDASAVTRIIEQQALADVGGISINFQLSSWPCPEVGLGSCADVQMIFGPYYCNILKQSGARSQYFIYHGYANDYAFAAVKEKSKQLRTILQRAGAQFIVSYFDENTTDDRMSTLTHGTSAYVYKKFLEWVIADETLGLICSPKKPKNLFQRIPEIQDLAERAKATGRCIFRESIDQTVSYSTESAQASDITVAHLAGGTVALESYLSGVRTVYLDLEGLYSFTEYKLGRGKIVFDNLDALINEINVGRKDKEVLNMLGNKDLVPHLKEKDPFQDGQAALRMGQYIQWLLEKMNDGAYRENVINYANAQYKKTWGSEYVISQIEDRIQK